MLQPSELQIVSGVQNARERVRAAIERRLDELHMTNRHFGRQFTTGPKGHHVDTWVTALLKGHFSLSLDELDEAARILKTTAAQLVKSDLEQAEYLTPSERELIRTMRELPQVIQEHILTLTEYLVGVAPDEIEFLLQYRDLSEREQQRAQHLLRVIRIGRDPEPELTMLHALEETSEKPNVESPRTRDERHKPQRRRKTER